MPPLGKRLQAICRDYTSRAVYLPLNTQISVSPSVCPGTASYLSHCREAAPPPPTDSWPHLPDSLENRCLPLPQPQTWTRMARQDSGLPRLLPGPRSHMNGQESSTALWLFGANDTTQPTFALTQWVPRAPLCAVTWKRWGILHM